MQRQTHFHAHMQTSTPNAPLASPLSRQAKIAGVCCQGVLGGQSVSVISVYVTSQSWEWHETHKASLYQSCGLQQSVPLH